VEGGYEREGKGLVVCDDDVDALAVLLVLRRRPAPTATPGPQSPSAIAVEQDSRMGGFVFRLLGPRPTFPGDMTPDEAEVMGRHAAYWRELTRSGTAVAFGPVLDPGGVYGLGVVRADDAAAAQAIADADPVVRAGIGFRVEIAPMMALVTKDDVDE
jgi:uncharacterized protein